MLSIVLVGFSPAGADKVSEMINAKLRNLGLEQVSTITFLNSSVRRCEDNLPEPYAIVRSEQPYYLETVPQTLSQDLGIGVEIEPIQSFLPPNPKYQWDALMIR
ncbi:hypothetical protein KW790_00280 [Candidatus Parcubacteria bacterium]|nr:hypothetical protein [Candidatus Parcubacteria bacterium]